MSPIWRKSTKSTNQGGACVEISQLVGAIGVRDSKRPNDGHLSLKAEQFAALIRLIKTNDLDL